MDHRPHWSNPGTFVCRLKNLYLIFFMVYEDDVCTMYYFTELAMKKMNKFAFDIIAQDTNLMLIIEFHIIISPCPDSPQQYCYHRCWHGYHRRGTWSLLSQRPDRGHRRAAGCPQRHHEMVSQTWWTLQTNTREKIKLKKNMFHVFQTILFQISDGLRQ